MKETSENFNYVVIAPLLDVFKNKDRNYVTRGEIEQIVKKVNTQLLKKSQTPAQKHSIYIEQEHLKVINTLMEEFEHSPRITKHELMVAADKILRAQNLRLYQQKHEKALPNHFHYHGVQGLVSPELDVYDLAFYVPEMEHHAKSHHISYTPSEDSSGDVFYLRCEDYVDSDSILIGNMQIDTLGKHVENLSAGQRALLAPKNLNLMMVQEAVRHALQKGKTNIMFHTAEAMQVAQFGKLVVSEELVTEENYAKMLADYQKEIDHFNEMQYGYEIINTDMAYKFYYGVVYEREPEYYKIAPLNHYMVDIMRLPGCLDVAEATKTASLSAALREGRLEVFIRDFHLMFMETFGYPRPVAGVDKKIKFLQDLMRSNTDLFLGDLIEKYSMKYYYKPLKRRQPENIKIVQGCDSGSHYYVDTNDKKCVVINKKDLIKPVLGKKYPVALDYMERDMYPYKHLSNKYNMYKWYNRRLPENLKKSGLSFEKISIISKDKEKNPAPVFRITGGLEEFKANPRYLFSSCQQIKNDTEALPRLQAAAVKFGLPPQKLSIIHQLISMNGAEEFTGIYDKTTDHITLAWGSLSALAHEGLHRLHSKRLIPAKEYKALVRAGKRLINGSQKHAEILRQDSAGRAIYPRGPLRAQEYAALFVETYYENNKLARKCLMNEKINVCEQILKYFQEVIDVIGSYLGNDAALARSFLRRVENNQLCYNNIPKVRSAQKNAVGRYNFG